MANRAEAQPPRTLTAPGLPIARLAAIADELPGDRDRLLGSAWRSSSRQTATALSPRAPEVPTVADRSDNARTMDQPHPNAALGVEPVHTISRDELKAKLDRGDDIRLIMALNRWAFDAKHIPGSIHFDTPDELYAAVGPNDQVVVYCSHVDCLSSVALYRDLVRRGYGNVRRYAGGLLDWEDAGLPLEGAFVEA